MESMSATRGRNPMKVKIIETRFVKTDPMSFKSVVQSLTGRESTMAAVVAVTEERSSVGRKDVNVGPSYGPTHGNLQLEELERMVMEMPPLDDLMGLWAY